MGFYYRIQPAGLGLNHRSETSNDELADGLHVFGSASHTLNTDAQPSVYGDEVVVIEAAHSWPNGDVEGECVDGATASVVARYTWPAWTALLDRFDGGQDWEALEAYLAACHLSR